MKKILITCRTGMGSSMLLKIKVEQALSALGMEADVYHDVTSALSGYHDIDILVTMSDLVEEMEGKFPMVVGINSLTDKEEIRSKIKKALDA